ncbi:MAG: GNAT family acetyltransferase [Gammaproteobacteria bacterium]|nr:MAG: GNAT family acetyltransferase [Gammaproteobacteria bacterium]
MNELEIRPYRAEDETAVIDLWRQCELIVPWNNPRADILRKCADSPELFFIGLVDNDIIATCMAGYDGHRGWIYYLAVAGAWQRQGIATRLVRHAEASLIELGCAKIDLMVRNTNDSVIAFYKSIGYGNDPVVVLSKRLLEDEAHDFT